MGYYTAEEEKKITGPEALLHFRVQIKELKEQIRLGMVSNGAGGRRSYDTSAKKHLEFCRAQLKRVRREMRKKA